jgi:hypothetical protein
VLRSPRRIVSYVLLVSAFQVRNPVGALIQVKPHNLTGSSG